MLTRSSEGIFDPSCCTGVAKVMASPLPQISKKLQQFLGFVNFRGSVAMMPQQFSDLIF